MIPLDRSDIFELARHWSWGYGSAGEVVEVEDVQLTVEPNSEGESRTYLPTSTTSQQQVFLTTVPV